MPVSVDGKTFEFKGLVFDNSVLELEFFLRDELLRDQLGGTQVALLFSSK